MQPDIPAAEARRIIEVRGAQRYVVPGLIDLHTHVAYGATTLGVGMECCGPDVVGVHAGVTTVLDCGSVGVANIGVFPVHILPRAKTRVIPFVNVGSYAHTMPGVADVARMEQVDAHAIAACMQANPGLSRRVTLRLLAPVASEPRYLRVRGCQSPAVE